MGIAQSADITRPGTVNAGLMPSLALSLNG
jgi:hypothetical protein